jgi:hypothetical protein
MPDTLEEQVETHLRTYPWLTAHEVSRALRRPSVGSVRKRLERMEDAGKAEHRIQARTDGHPGPRVEWRIL